MSTLDCRETFRKLDAYVDRELRPEELTQVEEHLQRCADCAGEFAVERELLEQIRHKLRRIKAPDALKQRISAALRAEGQS